MGDWGLRLESILRVEPANLDTTEYGDFIKYEAVTLVPFEPKLINFTQLRPDQIDWYNQYNAAVRDKVGPR